MAEKTSHPLFFLITENITFILFVNNVQAQTYSQCVNCDGGSMAAFEISGRTAEILFLEIISTISIIM